MAQPVPIDVVYGLVGTGYSRAHNVLANGIEYVAKGPSWVRQFRHLAANELVAAGLAVFMGLPMPDFRILSQAKKLFFGSVQLAPSEYHPAIDDYFFDLCENKDVAYELVVFDAWICNKDRHSDNLWVRCSGDSARTKRCTATTHSLLLIDHDGGLLPDDREASFFSNCLIGTRINEYVHLPQLKKEIVDPTRLGQAISVAESVSDGSIEVIVRSVPDQWLPPSDHDSWIAFLIERRNGLRKIFNDDRAFFAWLRKTGAI